MISPIEIRGLRAAYLEAMESPDTSNQNGAVLVNCHPMNYYPFVLFGDYNRFPEGFVGDVKDRDEKLFYIQHAERAVILKAALNGVQTRGLTLVCPWFACGDCAKAIIFAGIKRVVGHKQRMELTPERWKDNVKKANQYLEDCGVELEFYDGKLDCEPIIVNGELWHP